MSDRLGWLRGAIAFLTRLPVSADERGRDWDRFRAFPAAFPLVGYPIGAIVAVPFLVGGPPTVVAFGYLLALVSLVGVLHLDGVGDLGDAAAAHGREAKLRALSDTETGVGAIVAVAIVVAGLALAALEVAAMPAIAAVGLVVAAEVGAKLGMSTVACLGTASHEGLASGFTESATPPLLIGPVLAALPAALLFGPFPAGIVAVAVGPFSAVVLVGWSERTLGGVNGDVFGATNELARVLGLHAGVIVWTLS